MRALGSGTPAVLVGTVLAALLLSGALYALPKEGTLLEHFEGKTEADLVAEFEAELPAFLLARMAEPVKPQLFLSPRRGERVRMQCVAVDAEKRTSTWQATIRTGWISDHKNYGYGVDNMNPERDQMQFNLADLPPAEIASLFIVQYRPADEMIRLAVWLASKDDLITANRKLSELAQMRTDYRDRVERWLCEKNDWTRPDAGLGLIELHDLDRRRDSWVLMTDAARRDYASSLRGEAQAELNKLVEMANGTRRNPGATTRLEKIIDRAERYPKAYGFTNFLTGRSERTYNDLLTELQRRQKRITDNVHAAERLGIDQKWEEAARAYEALLVLDPWNTDLIMPTADAFRQAAQLEDAGLRARNTTHARKAAELYDRIIEVYPRAIGFYNRAGLAWLGAGDKRKAKERHEEVLARIEKIEVLTENDEGNRDYARNQIRVIDGR
jgi:tetratricopeptide (TPR) repeat protein